MFEAFKNIKVLIWDFDGTMYKQIPELWDEIMESAYKVVMHRMGWSYEKTVEEFNKIYQVKTSSTTQTVAMITGLPLPTVAIECEMYKDRRKYLHSDERLMSLFDKLKSFTHFMLVNGIQSKTRENLRLLGISPTLFSEIVTSEVVGENKPSEKGFLYILEKTKLPPEVHLMIGDREAVDLATAKKLGMKTCLVWGKSEIADISLPTVYDLAYVLL